MFQLKNEWNFVMNVPVIYILVGLPGSGKSTWVSKKILEENLVIVSTDDIIENIAKEKNLTYSDVWESSIKHATKLSEKIFLNALYDGKSIVWDQTNMTAKKRKTILSKIQRDYKKVCVVFEAPLDVIKERLVKREKETGKRIPEFVLINMLKSYEEPNLSEGFDKIIKVT